ncbi:MAG: MBL fold metallo-hydrolase [Anaerolineae bacterium]|nr:MBL fold metallo-hydrolase [Anaerolineae bacterium]
MGVKLLEGMRWLGHDSFVYEGEVTIYFDPWRLSGELPEADLILVSHEHGDHCSPEDVAKVSGAATVVVANVGAAPQLKGDVRVLRPGEELTVGRVRVAAVPAYNVDKFRAPGVPFHPKEAQHNGYVVNIEGERLYFAGDTDHIPEMAEIECDVALLPVSGKYVMTAEEAAEAARTIGPRAAVPMHYGAGVVGTKSDAERFKALYAGNVVLF